MKVNIGTYSFGGFESFLGLGLTILEKFQKIASLGFTGVELLKADLDFNTNEEIKAAAKATGLEIMSIHADPTDEIIERMADLGGKAVICASTPFCNKAEAIEVAKWLDEWAEKAAKHGIKIGYHNHSSEFYMDEGKTIWEHVADNSSKCFFQLDCGWAMNAGTYPPSLIRRYPGRFCAIHVKENNKVYGPGPKPRSRHAETGGRPMLPDATKMSREEREKMFEEMKKNFPMGGPGGDRPPMRQCPIADPTSNIDWKEIKAALDETSPDAFWVVEREEFYADHDQCIADDAKWIAENL